MTEVRWHGRGGQGCWTVARLLGHAATQHEGKYALAFPSFGPERRGAPVLGFTRIDDKKIRDRSEVQSCDYIVVLDETLIEKSTHLGLRENGTVVINSTDPGKWMSYFPEGRVQVVDATSIALKVLGRPITNTAMLGALIAVSGIVGLDAATSAIREEMKTSIREKNVEAVKIAFNTVRGEQ